jgi:carboxylesterase
VQDHVVSPTDGDALMAEYGGPKERIMLERSFHVATQDYDKSIIFEGAIAFALRMTS